MTSNTHAPAPPGADGRSFAETALKLGGKSEEEARRTGAIDKADDQVEALFAPQYQTTASPAHRAVQGRRRRPGLLPLPRHPLGPAGQGSAPAAPSLL